MEEFDINVKGYNEPNEPLYVYDENKPFSQVLFQIRERTHVHRYYIIRELYNCYNPDRPFYHLGPHKGRTANVIFLIKAGLIRPRKEGEPLYKAYRITCKGMRILVRFRSVYPGPHPMPKEK